jgi:hypothetical protein
VSDYFAVVGIDYKLKELNDGDVGEEDNTEVCHKTCPISLSQFV